MTNYLYKVSAPRSERDFYPSKFWHTGDWESSTTRRREGYIEDEVLFAGDFDEVSIHLLPRVHVVRVRTADADHCILRMLGIQCIPGKTAYIFVEESRRKEVEAFCPTIFRFELRGFKNVRKGEYVSWEPKRAISSQTFPLTEALERWNVELYYVENLNDLMEKLTNKRIYFDEQT